MGLTSNARAFLLAPLLVACGSRSGLLVPGSEREGDRRGAVSDAGEAPTLPATAFLGDCFGSAPPPIYLFTNELSPALFAFSPSTGAFAALPPPRCPAAPVPPVALAVDRSGTADLLLGLGPGLDGNAGTTTLNRIVLATGACTPLSLPTASAAPAIAGLTFAENSDGKAETLYVLTRNGALPPPSVTLATVDTGPAATRPVGLLEPTPLQRRVPSLIGTGGGELFALYPEPGAPVIARVDRVSGLATPQWLPTGVKGVVSGFAFWGGDFYIFQWVGLTEALRFRPSDGSLVVVARMTQTSARLGGATSSTCSPLR